MAAEQASRWPELNYQQDRDTLEVIHLLSQMMGKVRLALCPRMNQYWQVALTVGLDGLTTGPVEAQGIRFEIKLDLVNHRMTIQTQNGQRREIPLLRQSIAGYFAQFTQSMRELDLKVHLWPQPQEIEGAVRFDKDEVERNYNPDAARRYFQVLCSVADVLQRFRNEFQGKSSPVVYWWGSGDLAVAQFSGRKAPKHPPNPLLAYKVIADSYSHEECTSGFWPGGAGVDEAAFYAYIYPAPQGYEQWPVQPAAAYYNKELGEFILPYQAVRDSENPEEALMSFFKSTYQAAATLAKWDEAAFKYVPT